MYDQQQEQDPYQDEAEGSLYKPSGQQSATLHAQEHADQQSEQPSDEVEEDELYSSLSRFDNLTNMREIQEDDDVVIDCISRLKRFHTSLSKTLEFDIDPSLSFLRADICREATETVEHLTR